MCPLSVSTGGHLLLLAAMRVTDCVYDSGGGPMRVTDCVYDKNDPKNGLKVS